MFRHHPFLRPPRFQRLNSVHLFGLEPRRLRGSTRTTHVECCMRRISKKSLFDYFRICFQDSALTPLPLTVYSLVMPFDIKMSSGIVLPWTDLWMSILGRGRGECVGTTCSGPPTGPARQASHLNQFTLHFPLLVKVWSCSGIDVFASWALKFRHRICALAFIKSCDDVTWHLSLPKVASNQSLSSCVPKSSRCNFSESHQSHSSNRSGWVLKWCVPSHDLWVILQ